MSNNYIILFDETGSPYLSHAWLRKGQQRENHKYIARVEDKSGKYIYFYNQHDYDVWLKRGKRTLRNRIQDSLGWDERSARDDAKAAVDKKRTYENIKRFKQANEAYKKTVAGKTDAVKKYAKTKLSEVRASVDNIGVDEAIRYYANRNLDKVSYDKRQQYKQEYAETLFGKRDFARKNLRREKDEAYIKEQRTALENATNDYERAKKLREEAEAELKSIKKPLYSKEYLGARASVERLRIDEEEKERAMKREQRKFDKSRAGRLEDKYEKEAEAEQRDNDRQHYKATGELSDREKQQVQTIHDQIQNVNNIKSSRALDIVKYILPRMSPSMKKMETAEAVINYISSTYNVSKSQAEKLYNKAEQTGELDNVLKRPTGRTRKVTGKANPITVGREVNSNYLAGTTNYYRR